MRSKPDDVFIYVALFLSAIAAAGSMPRSAITAAKNLMLPAISAESENLAAAIGERPDLAAPP